MQKVMSLPFSNVLHFSLLNRAYSDAAVSITVTSLTDFLSFMCGAFTPIPSVRIYCLYTGVAVGFIYMWHITFFGACLVRFNYCYLHL